jgi:hypothetical protein
MSWLLAAIRYWLSSVQHWKTLDQWWPFTDPSDDR